MRHVEFTIEPFVDGAPGPHVTAPQDALRADEHTVRIGPFGTAVTVADHRVADVVAMVIREAIDNGATNINLHVTALDPDDPTGPRA